MNQTIRWGLLVLLLGLLACSDDAPGPPVVEVRCAVTVTGMPWAWQCASTSETSSVLLGLTSASACPVVLEASVR